MINVIEVECRGRQSCWSVHVLDRMVRQRYTNGTPYDMIRPIKVSTRQNINGTPTRHTVHHTITIKPGNVSTMRAYTNGTAYKHDEEPSMRVRPWQNVNGTPNKHTVHHTNIKPRQCKYDRVRTLTVHHTNTNKDTSKTTHKECGKHKWYTT